MARKAATSARRTSRSTRQTVIGDRYRLEGTYERLRRSLLEAPDDGRLDRPLSYWVLPTDRRLPLAFLDRELRELLKLPLSELMGTQGVGQKKILGFFDLLRRANSATSPQASFGAPAESAATRGYEQADAESTGFDPSTVSEAVWSEWCETIERCGLAPLRLGRIAPSLKPLPTVIWHKTLGDYSGLTLSKIRRLKTHGEKRVNAILEVFGATFEAVSTAALNEHLQIEVAPRFAPRATRWLVGANAAERGPSVTELEAELLDPLVRQIAIDLDDSIATLVDERLRIDPGAPTVKQQADRLNVTRARVYQLLDDCASVMSVRWPEGRWLLAPMTVRPAWLEPEASGLLHGLQTLFFPSERSREASATLRSAR